jgi:hypothetical protein
MSSLSFPDINVWLALVLEGHVHREAATKWWRSTDSETLAFNRLTQIGLLRLLTTASAMNGRPLTMPAAWRVYDALFGDDRVAFVDEPSAIDAGFRHFTRSPNASPKLWADAWLLAFAEAAGGAVVTFDRALGSGSRHVVFLS